MFVFGGLQDGPFIEHINSRMFGIASLGGNLKKKILAVRGRCPYRGKMLIVGDCNISD